MDNVNFFALTNWRDKREPVGIKREDRRLHMYVLGRTGVGKTTLLLNMALNDIYSGEGVAFVDPDGNAVESLLDYIPPERVEDVIYFNPSDVENPIPLNPLSETDPKRRHILVSHLISVFRRLYKEYFLHRQEHILRNSILALLEHQERGRDLFGRSSKKTLLDLYRLLTDWRYRKEIVQGLKDPMVKGFWEHEFSKYLYQFKGEAITPILNKLGAFLTVPLVRNIVGQEENKIDFRKVIDGGKILLVNLAKGRIGEDISSFLGSLIVTNLYLAAISRVDIPDEERRDFYLYVDEFQEFVASETFEGILSEARKYRLCLILSHQYIGQLSDELGKAIFGNVGSILAFPVGPENGEFLEKEFYPVFDRKDLITHSKYHLYIKLAFNGKTSEPFSANTLPPFYRFNPQGMREKIIFLSRQRYSVKGNTEISREK